MRKRLYPTKRLSMVLPEEYHKELERIATKRHETITRIVLEAIINRINWEKKYE